MTERPLPELKAHSCFSGRSRGGRAMSQRHLQLHAPRGAAFLPLVTLCAPSRVCSMPWEFLEMETRSALASPGMWGA